MLKRMIAMLAATMLIVTALGFVKFKQIQVAIAQGAAFQPPPEAVTTIVASQEDWPSTLTAIGTVAAVRGVTVSADLPGVVASIAFESGQSVREGEVLAILDTRQERAQLAAAEAQRDLAPVNFNRLEGLLNERVISRAEFDRATAEQYFLAAGGDSIAFEEAWRRERSRVTRVATALREGQCYSNDAGVFYLVSGLRP